MKNLGKFLIFLIIGIFFQLVIVFIALQLEGDISGAGKGTYAISYILCYVFAWQIVYRRRFLKFINNYKKQNLDKKINTETNSKTKETPVKKELTNKKNDLTKSQIPTKKSKNNFYAFLFVLIIFIAAIVHGVIKDKIDINNKEIYLISNIYNNILSGAFQDMNEFQEFIFEDNGYEFIFDLFTSKGQSIYVSKENFTRGFKEYYSITNLNDELNRIKNIPSENRALRKIAFLNVINQFPNQYVGYLNLGIHYSTGDLEEEQKRAVLLLTKALEFTSSNLDLSQIYYWRGTVKKTLKDKIGYLNDFKLSIENSKNALKNNPNDSAILYTIGRSFSQINENTSYPKSYIESIFYLKKALDNYDENNFEKLNNTKAFDDGLDPKSLIYRRIYFSYAENIYKNRSTIDYKKQMELEKEFCLLMSKAGEEGYGDAYDAIKSYCN